MVAASSALTCLPSMVSVFAAIKWKRCNLSSDHRGKGLLTVGLPIAIGSENVLLKQFGVFLAEKPQRAQHGIRRRLTETAQAGIADHIAKLLQSLQIPSGGFAIKNLG